MVKLRETTLNEDKGEKKEKSSSKSSLSGDIIAEIMEQVKGKIVNWEKRIMMRGNEHLLLPLWSGYDNECFSFTHSEVVFLFLFFLLFKKLWRFWYLRIRTLMIFDKGFCDLCLGKRGSEWFDQQTKKLICIETLKKKTNKLRNY